MKQWLINIRVGVVMATLICTVPAAAEISLKPYISVVEEATDNLFERAGNGKSEFTTRIRPGFTSLYSSPFWSWDAAYSFEYRNFARNSKGDEYNHDAAVKANISPLEKLLFIDLGNSYHRVSLDVSRTAATESSLFLNQTDQNIATVSPYLLWQLRGDNTLKTGYQFTDTRYWDKISIDKQEHKGFADLKHEVTSRLSLTGGYSFTRLESIKSQFNKHDLYGGFKYEFADKSFVSGQLGNSWQQFNSGVDVNYLFWNAGISHDYNSVVATLETKVSATEDPLAISTKETSYGGTLAKTLQRGMVGVSASYSDYVNTATDRRDRRKLTFGATGRYEIIQDLTATLAATAERFSRKSVAEYPYRFSGTAGVGYAFNHDLNLNLTYSYVTYLYDLDTTTGSKDINKVVVEVKKGF